MDRLSIVGIGALVGALTWGCKSEPGEKPAATTGRVNAVESRDEAVEPAEFCDQMWSASEAPSFRWPELTSPPPSPRGEWQWVNVWATWCKPCVEELPLLARWQQRSRAPQTSYDVWLVSADEDEGAIESFRTEHPGTPPSLRIAEADQVEAWLTSVGVTSASLPVHLFVGPGSKVRCTRTSGVDENDEPVIAAILAGALK